MSKLFSSDISIPFINLYQSRRTCILTKVLYYTQVLIQEAFCVSFDLNNEMALLKFANANQWNMEWPSDISTVVRRFM